MTSEEHEEIKSKEFKQILDKFVCSASSIGFINGSYPTGTKLSLEAWGGSWNSVGNTETFTDANNIVKEITSTDQTTLFEKVRIVISTASSQRRSLAEAEYYVLRPA